MDFETHEPRCVRRFFFQKREEGSASLEQHADPAAGNLFDQESSRYPAIDRASESRLYRFGTAPESSTDGPRFAEADAEARGCAIDSVIKGSG